MKRGIVMKFNLHTDDIQYLIIALCCTKTDTILTEEVKERLSDKLCELNRMCCEENDYTLSVEVYEENPRVIVEVEGGMVRSVHADRKIDVDVLDMDNYYASDSGSEDESFCEELMCENGLLQRVW